MKTTMTANGGAGTCVVQGYNGIAAVDAKHQVIVGTEAFGSANEAEVSAPMAEQVRENFQELGEEDIYRKRPDKLGPRTRIARQQPLLALRDNRVYSLNGENDRSYSIITWPDGARPLRRSQARGKQARQISAIQRKASMKESKAAWRTSAA